MTGVYCREDPDSCYLEYDTDISPYDMGVQHGANLVILIALCVAWFYCKNKKEKK